MKVLVLSAVLFAILLSLGCTASSSPPPVFITPPAVIVTGTIAVLGVTPSSATPPSLSATVNATPLEPPPTRYATPHAGVTLAPRRQPGTAPAAGELNVTFERSGGFTGRNEMFRLKPDGSVDDGKVVLHSAGGSSDAVTLATQIAATGIYAVAPGRYMSANTCCDRIEYDLTLTQNSQSYNFITIDSEASAPSALMQTIRLISLYINAAN